MLCHIQIQVIWFLPTLKLQLKINDIIVKLPFTRKLSPCCIFDYCQRNCSADMGTVTGFCLKGSKIGHFQRKENEGEEENGKRKVSLS